MHHHGSYVGFCRRDEKLLQLLCIHHRSQPDNPEPYHMLCNTLAICIMQSWPQYWYQFASSAAPRYFCSVELSSHYHHCGKQDVSFWRLFLFWFHSTLGSNLTFQNAACSLTSFEVQMTNLIRCRNRCASQFNLLMHFIIWRCCPTAVTNFWTRKITPQKGNEHHLLIMSWLAAVQRKSRRIA